MVRRVAVLTTIAILLAASWRPARAQTAASGSRYFRETGHYVRGEFLKYYESNPHALLLYGYPITEDFISKDGKRVQYFQRARFEYHENLPEGQRILLTPLGRHLYVSAGALNVNNSFACRTYVETGFAVCFAFLEFFDQYGGVAQFGFPISGFEYHENRIVQYFERARFEWQPWRAEGQRVVISDLGRIYFDVIGEEPTLLPPLPPPDNTISPIVSLQARAFVWKAVTLASDNQLIFIILQDQNLQPVALATCAAAVHWPNGRKETLSIVTNTNGVGITSLTFADQPYGSLIYIEVVCSHSGLSAATTTSFRIWY